MHFKFQSCIAFFNLNLLQVPKIDSNLMCQYRRYFYFCYNESAFHKIPHCKYLMQIGLDELFNGTIALAYL